MGAEFLRVRDGVDFFFFSNPRTRTVDFMQLVPIVWRAVAREWRRSIAALTFDVHLRQDYGRGYVKGTFIASEMFCTLKLLLSGPINENLPC